MNGLVVGCFWVNRPYETVFFLSTTERKKEKKCESALWDSFFPVYHREEERKEMWERCESSDWKYPIKAPKYPSVSITSTVDTCPISKTPRLLLKVAQHHLTTRPAPAEGALSVLLFLSLSRFRGWVCLLSFLSLRTDPLKKIVEWTRFFFYYFCIFSRSPGIAQWVKRWPTELADRVRSPLKAKSS